MSSEKEILFKENEYQTNVGLVFDTDYYNKTCFYQIGDKIAFSTIDYKQKYTYDDLINNCIICEIIELHSPFWLGGFGEHKDYYDKLHHEKITIKFPDNTTLTVSPRYYAIIGKFII